MRTISHTLVGVSLAIALGACASTPEPKTADIEARRMEGQRQVAQAEYVRMEQQREAQRRFDEAQNAERRMANTTPTPTPMP
jgi:hypothetical protein